ncbi:delta(3,5)-Delta(2,4)-dienoyl-CoA isomerase, mitochondrial-like isoform X2 [Acanthaster planci]|nr:delta(3,5)-Delta(2,4)-dienoyl-CoA isomerase, mitochondrial-like isoform X2 [Acanthaster planci]XP_022107022.1 delta(3,5)-Delta(2,4)-dienoyl-CoA isomerase, mitochondrial-like isoform X2 [Acanthaster planci]XP_022107023.1 delta(3,5)-Delta(2,4)-dienoyl-CoA isomerase, mitochondrial-like isoform X2 [Acanthaster planci]
MSSDAPFNYSYETLAVSQPRDYVKQVEINRPEIRNAMNQTFYREMRECFRELAVDGDCRVVLLTGAGKIFTSGLDLVDSASLFSTDTEVGRKAVELKQRVSEMQESFTVMEKCLKPVIAAVHGACVGAGVDMITACDIRLCTQDAWFQIKEVEMGLAADLGTLQRFPKIIGDESWLREIIYTARKFSSDEAREKGFVSGVFETREAMLESAIETACIIASRSPIAVQTSKASVLFSRDHSVADGLNDVTTWNASMLQSEDLMKATTAAMQKTKPTFSKL